jgi:hypothetical protein
MQQKTSAFEDELNRWALARAIHQDLSDLRYSLKILGQQKPRGLIATSPSTKHAFLLAERSYSCLAKQLRSLVIGIPLLFRSTEASAAKALKVFTIPELLEQILLGCDVRDLYAVQQVNHVFAKGILSSNKIQRSLGLCPMTEGPAFSPLSNSFFASRGCLVLLDDYHRFGNKLEQNDILLMASLNAIGMAGAKQQSVPKVGDRLRNVLVCQPPIKKMRARTGKFIFVPLQSSPRRKYLTFHRLLLRSSHAHAKPRSTWYHAPPIDIAITGGDLQRIANNRIRDRHNARTNP